MQSVVLVVVGGLAGCVQNIQKLSTATLAGAKPSPETTESIASTSQGTTTTTATTATTTTTTATTATTTTATTTATTATTTTTTATQTSTEPWTPPEPPNRPIQTKEEDRITDGEFINTVEAPDGSGYTDFDIRVGANTWMMGVDPPKDEDGEPYFIAEINGQLIARTDIVPFRKEGSFTISIPAPALQQFDSGTLEIRVVLLDEDHSRDDLYGTWTMTIEYSND